MGWDRLVALAGGTVALVLVWTGALKGDKEALILGGGFAIAVVVSLAVPRMRTILHIGLGLLFANVLFWMATAAIANASPHQDVAATDAFIPIALSVASLTGLVGIIVGGVDRRRPVPGATPMAVGATVLILGAVLWTQVTGLHDRERLTGGVDAEVAFGNMVFEPDRIELPAGVHGVLDIATRNRDLFWHTFTIDELDVDLRVPVGARRRATFDAPPGTYEYYCAIPGHRTLGMKGVLVVD